MKTTNVKIAGRVFHLAFMLNAHEELQENIPDFDVQKISEYSQDNKLIPILLTALARQGEILNGADDLDVDAKWFGSHIPFNFVSLVKIKVAILDAFSYGLMMEMENDADVEVDVALEELKKKEHPDG